MIYFSIKLWLKLGLEISSFVMVLKREKKSVTFVIDYKSAVQLVKNNCLVDLIALEENVGIDFTVRDSLGKTLFDYAIEYGHRDLSLWLFEKTGKPTIKPSLLLLWAIINNQEQFVANLIWLKVINNYNVQDNNNIAIITAVRYGYLFIAQQLIDVGADITAQNNLALKFAEDSCDIGILNFVLRAKLDIDQRNKAASKIQYLWENYKFFQKESELVSQKSEKKLSLKLF